MAKITKVIALAAYTNVVKAETNKRKCMVDTVTTASVTSKCCNEKSIPIIYLSTDYVIPIKKGLKSPFYSTCKFLAEGEAKDNGACIVRISFVTPEQVADWRWANDYTISNRWWVEDAAENLCRYINSQSKEKEVNLGPRTPTTNYRMLAARYPHHPALLYRIWSCAGIKEKTGIQLPKNTQFSKIFTDY